MAKLRLETWLADPEPIVRAAFAEEGAVARAYAKATGRKFRPQPEQVEYAVRIARCAVAGHSEPAKFVALEAETGIGKTLGYAVPGVIHALLTGDRFLVSTFTIELQRSLAHEDGPVAAAAAAEFTGKKAPRFAARLAARSFASPTRCRNLAARLEGSENYPDAPASLRALADWADAEIGAFAKDGVAAVAAGRGTIAAFCHQEPGGANLPMDLADLFTLSLTKCREAERALKIGGGDRAALKAIVSEILPYDAYAAMAKNAPCIVATHAATVVDQYRFGALFGKDVRYGLVVIDEADRFESAARSVLGEKIALSSTGHFASEVWEAAKSSDNRDVMSAARPVVDANEDLYEFCRTLARRPADRLEAAGEPRLVAKVTEVAKALAHLASKLKGTADDTLSSFAEEADERALRMEVWIEACGDKSVHTKAILSFSPFRGQPSLVVDAKWSGRILQRIWREQESGASAVAFTSATLGTPGTKGPAAFSDVLKSCGLDDGDARMVRGLCGSFAPKRFGSLSFKIAHPETPKPTGMGRDRRAWGEWVANCIRSAYAEKNPKGRANVLVLANSFADAVAIGEALSDLGDTVLFRTDAIPLRTGLAWFREPSAEGKILITPGAWEGVNLPGLIDHLVVPRLPFSGESGRSFSYMKEGEKVPSFARARMMRKLKQGFGRALRQASDRAKIHVLDSRFPVPPAVASRVGSHSKATTHGELLACVPVRFRDALDDAEVHDLPARPWDAQAA